MTGPDAIARIDALTARLKEARARRQYDGRIGNLLERVKEATTARLKRETGWRPRRRKAR